MSIGLSNAQTLLADFAQHDNLETVSLTAGSITTSGIQAIPRKLSFKQIALGGTLGIQATDKLLCLGVASLNGAIPARGNTLTDQAGVTYTILSSDLFSVSGTPIYYETICTKQAGQ